MHMTMRKRANMYKALEVFYWICLYSITFTLAYYYLGFEKAVIFGIIYITVEIKELGNKHG